MIATLIWELRRRRTALVWWTLGSILISAGILALYPPIRNQAHQFNKLINGLPEGLRQLKSGGSGSINVGDPISFINSQLLYITLPIIWIILAITTVNGLVNKDEENRTIELTLARPISRTRLLLAKYVSFFVECIIVGGITLIAVIILAPAFKLNIDTARLTLAMAYTMLFCMSFGWIAFMFGAASQLTRKFANVLAVIASFGGYLITSLSAITTSLTIPAKFSPYHYFSPDNVLLGRSVKGLNIYLIATLLVTLLIAIVGFRRRDLA